MSFDPSDLTIGVLELFVEQYKWTTPRSLIATHESGGERVGRNPKMKFFGFTLLRPWQCGGAYQWRREAGEQETLDERARSRANFVRYRTKTKERWRAYDREWRQRQRANRTQEQREAQNRHNANYRRRKQEKAEQAAKLEAWKATAHKTKPRLSLLADSPETQAAERRRAQRVAQAQRRRDRMSKEQKAAEVLKAQQRRIAKAKV